MRIETENGWFEIIDDDTNFEEAWVRVGVDHFYSDGRRKETVVNSVLINKQKILATLNSLSPKFVDDETVTETKKEASSSEGAKKKTSSKRKKKGTSNERRRSKSNDEKSTNQPSQTDEQHPEGSVSSAEAERLMGEQQAPES